MIAVTRETRREQINPVGPRGTKVIRSNFRHFLTLVRYRRPDTRAFLRLAYMSALKPDPDNARYRHHEADLLQGRPPIDLPREPLNHAEHGTATLDLVADIARSDEFIVTARVQPEDVDELVRLAFRSLLRRDPDSDTYAAYRDGFERGTTFVDLVKDITASEEYQMVEERIETLLAEAPQAPSPRLDHAIASDLAVALTLLEMRLSEKGCAIQLGAVLFDEIDAASAPQRMRSLMTTLSLVDRL